MPPEPEMPTRALPSYSRHLRNPLDRAVSRDIEISGGIHGHLPTKATARRDRPGRYLENLTPQKNSWVDSGSGARKVRNPEDLLIATLALSFRPRRRRRKAASEPGSS
jgi:hypothetical protein